VREDCCQKVAYSVVGFVRECGEFVRRSIEQLCLLCSNSDLSSCVKLPVCSHLFSLAEVVLCCVNCHFVICVAVFLV